MPRYLENGKLFSKYKRNGCNIVLIELMFEIVL